MSVSLKIEEDRQGALFVCVEGELTVQHAAELKSCLLEALNNAQSVRVGLRNIEDIDLTCLQILCSAHKSALLAGKALTLDDNSPADFERTLDLSGFSRSRGCSVDLDNSCLWTQRR